MAALPAKEFSMRSRAVVLLVAILLVAGFAALNWGEVIRPAPLLFGPVVMDAPLGAILLGLLLLATVAFVLAAGAIRTQSLVESHTHHKTLEAQRTLADKAEASRFTDLRQHLDTQLRELRERDALAATEFQKSVVQGQRELRTQLEQINRTLAARLSEMEHRLENRFERVPGYGPASSVPATMRAEHVQATADRHEAAQDMELREAQLREEHARTEPTMTATATEPTRDDRIAATGERPAESGWRRWF
jgi:TolA-binding protein